ncbi:MAG: hypothetical protein GXP33_03155 [Spirochaetes bacterium]|nr:hypothetical protein [Spirochaetota bacterium]
MKRQIFFLPTILFFFISLIGVFAESSASKTVFSSFVPSVFGISGAFGCGYGFGKGADLAKDALLETGAESARAAGYEVWQIDVFTQWSLTARFGAALDISGGPLAFAALGYNAEGKPAEGRSYSYFNIDSAALVSFNLEFHSGVFFAMIGPLLGFRTGDGHVFLKSNGVTSAYIVPGDQMLNASLGGMLSSGYSLSMGPGYIDLGLKITYHYSSAQGFLTHDSIPVHIIALSVFAGYSFRSKNNGSEN